jgi:hypothetical protein
MAPGSSPPELLKHGDHEGSSGVTFGLPPVATVGLYGKKLATIAASLILDALKTPAVRGHIREGREKASR